MPSAADIITYIGVPLTVAGVIPLIWNMFKAFAIRRTLSKQLGRLGRPYCSLIADPAAGTVTVISTTPELAQTGLWTEPVLVSTKTRKNTSRSILAAVQLLVAIISVTFTVFWMVTGSGLEPRRQEPLQDDEALGHSRVAESDTEKGEHDSNTALNNDLEEQISLDLDLRRLASASLLHLLDEYRPSTGNTEVRHVRHGPCIAQVTAASAGQWMGLLDTIPLGLCKPQKMALERRHIVDNDMRVENMFLAMSWPQFIWFALALGVDQYDLRFQRLLEILTRSESDIAEMIETVTLVDHCSQKIMRIGQHKGKLAVELYLKSYHYDLRTAFAAEHIMLLDSQRIEGVPVDVLCTLSGDQIDSLSNIAGIYQAGFALSHVQHRSYLTGCALEECGDPLTAAFRWLGYTTAQYYDGPVSQELLEVRERCLWRLHITNQGGSLNDCLKGMFPDGSLASAVYGCLVQLIDSSPYVVLTETICEQFDELKETLIQIFGLQASMPKIQANVLKNIAEDGKYSKRLARAEHILSSLRDIRLLRANPTHSSAKEDDARRYVWAGITICSGWKEHLKDLGFPRQPADVVGADGDSMKALKEVYVAPAMWDLRSARHEWSQAQEVSDALQKFEGSIQVLKDCDRARAEHTHKSLKQMPSGRELFEQGTFRAPISPVHSIFGEKPDHQIPEGLKVYLF